MTGRNTQGVKLVNLDDGDLVTAVARVIPDEKGEDDAMEEEMEEPLVDQE